MSNYPTLSMDFDASSYVESKEDPADRTKMDGGIVVTRRKFTRPPRKTFKFSYKELPDADKVTLENFYDSVGGGSDMFTWTTPQGASVDVRFSKPIDFSFTGYGVAKIFKWKADIELEQV